MELTLPEWLNPEPLVRRALEAGDQDVRRALSAAHPEVEDFAVLLSPAADAHLEAMAQRAQALTRHHFGHTISLYVPLYLSNHCPGGCAYCGFASDRQQPRHRLSPDEVQAELEAIHALGFEEILLLTGERTPMAGVEYLADCVRLAARRFHLVTVETFAMTAEEYGALVRAGATGVTLYQETYAPEVYQTVHRWGPKRDYHFRLEAPGRALKAGMRTVGLGALLGLSDPRFDAIALLQHLKHLQKEHWQGGFSVSFPRLRPEAGGYQAACPVGDRLLAQFIYAFRLCLPDVPLVLSTRESPVFRDGMAGVGISKMSIGSRTTVGGYHEQAVPSGGQFAVNDTRPVETFLQALQSKGLQPVFKNWDASLSDAAPRP